MSVCCRSWRYGCQQLIDSFAYSDIIKISSGKVFGPWSFEIDMKIASNHKVVLFLLQPAEVRTVLVLLSVSSPPPPFTMLPSSPSLPSCPPCWPPCCPPWGPPYPWTSFPPEILADSWPPGSLGIVLVRPLFIKSTKVRLHATGDQTLMSWKGHWCAPNWHQRKGQ